MPRPRRPRDPNQLGKLIVDMATGAVNEAPEDSPRAAGARKGGIKGGRARAAKLTPEERADIARVAAQARWKKSR